jgi:prepilin-type N-terminal cleavage/methylation domain-containing protein
MIDLPVKIKNEKGFTLVEVMISILALTLLSGFILEMFLVASGVNQQAQDMDAGSTRAMNIIESFKQCAAPFDLDHDPLLAGAFSDISGQELRLSLYYDAQWNPVQTPSVPEEVPPGARFNMEVRVSPYSDAEGAPVNVFSHAYQFDGLPVEGERVEGAIYAIQIQIYQLDSNSAKTPLTELASNHYFVY